MRTQKKVGSTTYNYYYTDGRLVRQTWGSNYMDFLYDENGSAYSFIYNGTQYYYVKNLQGDVVRILNASGATVVAYSYDAWGKCTVTTGASNAIANANPIRYRGYYYDTDTGFYYLQSRYYDPTIKRFISADDAGLLGVNGDFTSLNLYAYCGNNPVARSDDGGEAWTTIAKIGIGVLTRYASDVVSNINKNGWCWKALLPTSSIGEYIAAGVTSIMPGSGMFSTVIKNITSEGIEYIEKSIKGEEFNFAESVGNVIKDSLIDYSFGKVSDFLGDQLQKLKPKNYSSYAGKLRSKSPNISKERIHKKLRNKIKRVSFYQKSTSFTIDAIVGAYFD